MASQVALARQRAMASYAKYVKAYDVAMIPVAEPANLGRGGNSSRSALITTPRMSSMLPLLFIAFIVSFHSPGSGWLWV